LGVAHKTVSVGELSGYPVNFGL